MTDIFVTSEVRLASKTFHFSPHVLFAMADFLSTESNNAKQKFMLADMAAGLNRPVVKIAKVNADLSVQHVANKNFYQAN